MIDLDATMQAYAERMNHAYRSKGLTQLIERELQSQHTRYGYPQPWNLNKWAVILGEEYGEVCKGVYSLQCDDSEALTALKGELIRVAAVALNMIMHLEDFENSFDFLNGKLPKEGFA
jgi:hypothetical protein